MGTLLGMYEMYVDESGNPAPAVESCGEGYFVLVGIAVHEKDASAARMRVRDLNQEISTTAGCAVPEFHAVDIWNSRGSLTSASTPSPCPLNATCLEKWQAL